MKGREQDGYLLWIADLEVQSFLKGREIELNKQILLNECGLLNNHVDEAFLDGLKNNFYELEEIKEELVRARQKRAEHLKKCPTQKSFSEYGYLIEHPDEDVEDEEADELNKS